MKWLELLGSSIQIVGSPYFESTQLNSDTSKYGYVGMTGFSTSFGLDIDTQLAEDVYIAWGPKLSYLQVKGKTSTNSGDLSTELKATTLGASVYPYFRISETGDVGLKLSYEIAVARDVSSTLGNKETTSTSDSLWRIIVGPQVRKQIGNQWIIGGSISYDTGKLKDEEIYGFQVGASVSYIIPFKGEPAFDLEKETKESNGPIAE